MLLRKTVVLLSLCLFALPTFAGSKNIWKDCGIGAMIFPNTGWAAITSNIIWDWGTTASTTTTSSESQCAGKSASTAKFINQNYAVLEEETAVGQGAHLVTMLNLLGCDKMSHDQIVNSVRSNFSSDIQNSNYQMQNKSERAEKYFDGLMNAVETNFSSQCQAS